MRQAYLFLLCYGDGGELAQLQLLLLTDGWEARPARCMSRESYVNFCIPDVSGLCTRVVVKLGLATGQRLTVVLCQGPVGKHIEQVEGLCVL